MGKRRGNFEGTVRERADGRYEARLSYVDPETGRRKRASVYAASRKAAMDKLSAARDRIEAGSPPRDATRTVGDWLRHWRQTTLVASDRKATTKELYARLCAKHLENASFGAIRLDRLRPSDIEVLVLKMRASTKPAQIEGAAPVRALSDSTIRQVYTILRSGLDGAVRDGLLARNPAAAVKRPGIERTEARHLTAEQVSRLLKAADGSRYYPVLALIANTGLRKGEALALSWNRVDLDVGVIKVATTLARVDGVLICSEPKTQRSRRTVPLAPAMVTMLRKHRAAQAAERLRAVNQWHDSDLVFTNELGGPMDPRNILRVIEAASKRAGFSGVGAHTLRHSAAVAWLESGVHIRQVADLLGHSSISVTGDIYGHGSDDGARAAVLTLGARLNL